MGQHGTDEKVAKTARFLPAPDVVARVGLSRSQIYRMVDSGEFPKPVRVTPKRVAWVEAEIEEWMQEKIEERDGD